ncbi:MAG: secreted PhoX family phosphatase [Roseivirga sp.]|jgi:secreted PhoX family phosphatase
MKKSVLFLGLGAAFFSAKAQTNFNPEIDVTNWEPTTIIVPSSPLITQYLFIGGHHKVQTTATYGNNAGEALAKQWHDFIGFTPDNAGSDLGWISVNHEMVVANDSIGDGGGMSVFKVRRDPATDSLIIVDQTLSDGRQGKFFAVDFANTVGETGMNCGGITSPDGRIWTAEEWWRGSNANLADRDTGMFTIGTGTATSPVSEGFPAYDGQTIAKYENYNYMVEIDPREAKAIRKQYNWGRQAFEGGAVMPDNKTVYLGADGTPGFFTKFVATTAGDFTIGTTSVYKHDATGSKWVVIDNSDLNNMLNFDARSVSAGASMFNRIEWVTEIGGKVYFTETGRDNPGSRWAGEKAAGAVFAPHHLVRAAEQSLEFGKTISPDSSEYWDYYGRVMMYDPATSQTSVFLEGGPYFTVDPSASSYPDKHLSNPDGLNKTTINGKDYMLINEDLNGTSKGRTPAGISNRTCELFMLDMSIANPTLNDLVRIAVVPVGAEITGAIGTTDGKTILFNVQHPSTSNPFPFNNSLTVAITGWDQVTIGIDEEAFEGKTFEMYPNPATRTLYFRELSDIAIYNVEGKRMNVYRQVQDIDISHLNPGVYYVQNAAGQTQKLLVN